MEKFDEEAKTITTRSTGLFQIRNEYFFNSIYACFIIEFETVYTTYVEEVLQFTISDNNPDHNCVNILCFYFIV